MAAPAQLSGPVTVEQDGWILSSGSSHAPTEADLKAALNDADVPAAAKPVVEDPATPAVVEPAAEPPVEEVAAAGETPAVEEPPAAGDEPAADAVATTPAKLPKKHYRTQLRIDRLTAEKSALDAQLTEERRQREQLQRDLEAARRGDTPVVTEPEKPAVAEPRPMWQGATGMEAQGKSYEEFLEAVDAWRDKDNARVVKAQVDATLEAARQKDKDERTRTETETSTRQAAEAYQARIVAARVKHPDFDAVITENLADLPSSPMVNALVTQTDEGAEILYHFATHPDVAEIVAEFEPTRPMMDAFLDSKTPLKLLSHFAQHPDEFHRLTTLRPVSVIREIGALEAQLGVAPRTGSTPVVPAVTRAAPPLRPVAGGAQRPNGAKPTTTAADIEFGPEYIAAANREEAATDRRRRGL